MANSLLEMCNNWQIHRAKILARNPEMDMTIQKLDMMIHHSVCSAIDISRHVDLDLREAEKEAKRVIEGGT